MNPTIKAPLEKLNELIDGFKNIDSLFSVVTEERKQIVAEKCVLKLIHFIQDTHPQSFPPTTERTTFLKFYIEMEEELKKKRMARKFAEKGHENDERLGFTTTKKSDYTSSNTHHPTPTEDGIWRATNNLRYEKRPIGGKNTVKAYQRVFSTHLQQMWINGTGQEDWLDVSVVPQNKEEKDDDN